ncbi:pyruvate dehydrogenase E2 component (dihydrolipoamide acetyltransferase) [Mycobacterium frederiksbergense]|uniref:Dihydrolipoamide acetyltransferase component of pyruvate dehydrogenase complex n=1 Tax=Mycolicibacterium frederiksbergense TaxID=117567 RepID=A0ABT6KTM1_9MYCO|nr:dihydrolipoamide acetyltransferase family protein [Mycolicibacterium frederiksbergense]MDH6194022.1 pyruvate dehydrogenase E2 component (dihydrolipoamide acetyltransferase) [Mycolicibacterium frederiksbergense]
MIEFKMPALGSDMDAGTLNEWLVKPGDTVTRGQAVAVVETTKAAVEVECWQDGIVHELLVPVGETVETGTPLANLLADGESAPTEPKRPVRRPKAPAKQVAPRRLWISPAARRLAASLGVDVEAVTGTGPQGAVTIRDVEHFAAAVTKPPAAAAATDRATQMRKSIAAAMTRSKHEIPHYYLAEEIPMEKTIGWLTDYNGQRSITERVLPAVLQLKAVGIAAQRFTEFNGFWRDGGFQPGTGIHIGIAISLRGGGLVAPAIHDVADKEINELMRNLTDLVARARAGSLRSSEMSDPTITVTNLGDQGVDSVLGVIYPPQVALIGFGRQAQRVRVVDGGIRVMPTVQATLSADHRASDGHRGALFLDAINELLQLPERLEK